MHPVNILAIFAIVFGQLEGGTTESDTTTTPSEDYQRTVIFIQKYTSFGQHVFLAGGIDHSRRTGCTGNAETSPCAIPITHTMGGNNQQFNDWKTGDDYLDWYGSEDNQGSSGGASAKGTPMVWTTNDVTYSANVSYAGYGYTSLNTWGAHYWMVELDMDCSKTENGWFEVKGILLGWETDRNQDDSCTGNPGGEKPYNTGNHFGRCGYLNKFTFNENDCLIESLE